MPSYPNVWLNDVLLDDNETYALDPSMPPRVTNVPVINTVTVPGRDGSLWTPQGAHPSPLFTVAVLVAGAGADMDARHENCSNIIEMLGALVGTARVPIRYEISATQNRYAEGRVSTFDVVRPGLDYATVTIVLELLHPFWWDSLQLTTVSRIHYGTTPHILPDEMVGTAPIIDAKIKIIGPATSITLRDVGSGDYFQYALAVIPFQTLLVDTATLRGVVGFSGPSWTSLEEQHSADPSMGWGGTGAYNPNSFRIQPFPQFPGDPPDRWTAQLVLTAGSISSATRLEVQARKAIR